MDKSILIMSKATLLIVFGAMVYLCMPEAFAFADPIVRKAHDAQRNLIQIGKVVTALSFVFAIIMFVMGKPQWKWFGYIIVGGTALTSVDPLLRWISH